MDKPKISDCGHPCCQPGSTCRKKKAPKPRTPLKRVPMKVKKVKIRNRGKKLAKEMRLYIKEVSEFIQPGDQCELNTEVCRGEATCVHHTKGRIGKLLRDKRYWKKSCAHCNIHVEIKDKEAREQGLKLTHFEVNYKREK